MNNKIFHQFKKVKLVAALLPAMTLCCTAGVNAASDQIAHHVSLKVEKDSSNNTTGFSSRIEFGDISLKEEKRIVKDILVENKTDVMENITTSVQFLTKQCSEQKLLKIDLPDTFNVPAGQSVIIPVVLTSFANKARKAEEISCSGAIYLNSDNKNLKYGWNITLSK